MFLKKKSAIDTNTQKITELLSRGVEDVFVKESLEKRLKSGKQLRIKLGIDPTGPKIHLGRAIPLKKLRAFQDLGHKAVLIVGDFTAQIGDPSDKLEKRPMLTQKVIKENLKHYLIQIGKIVDVKSAEIRYNSEWLSKLGFQEISELAESFSIQQMSSRRNFKDRFDRGEEVSLREFMYPLMQGYDSVAVNADVELGGFDQLFNLKAGRIIQKHYKKEEQDVLTIQMLEGTDGRKMSTSWGNIITIVDEPGDMFGKIMSIKDELISKYFLLCTDLSEKDIEKIEADMKSGMNPREAKVRLAKEIVSLYHGQDAADNALRNFENTFKQGGVPEDAPTVVVPSGTLLVDTLLEKKLIESKSEWRRLVGEGAVTVVGSEEKIADPSYTLTTHADIKVGKRRFIRIKIK
jgi:tyrosyl-tRNA synthetase